MGRAPESFAREFHAYYLQQGRWPAALCFLFIGVQFAIGPLYFDQLLGLPREVPTNILWVQWGLIVPCCLLTAAAQVFWYQTQRTEWILVLSTLLVSVGIISVRRLWQMEGIHFPVDFSIFFMALIAAMSGVGRRLWIAVLPALGFNLAACFMLYKLTPEAYFEAIGIVSTGLVVATITWQVQSIMQRMWSERQHFESLSRTDPLTGLLNRRAFEENAAILMGQARRSQKPLAVVMLDIDYFKRFNDTYGHSAGDGALQLVAQTLASHARRPLDLCARTGGEEFAIVWYGVSESQAQQLCDNLIEAIRQLGIPHKSQPTGPFMTISLGACQTMQARQHEFEELLAKADQNLYLAKQQGRNRHVLTASQNFPKLAASGTA